MSQATLPTETCCRRRLQITGAAHHIAKSHTLPSQVTLIACTGASSAQMVSFITIDVLNDLDLCIPTYVSP